MAEADVQTNAETENATQRSGRRASRRPSEQADDDAPDHAREDVPPMTRHPGRPSAEGASPAMAQWFALKSENPDMLLFFRMGDFYELFFDDAAAAAAALDIALTARGSHAGAPIPMCGVPVGAASAYLSRLIRRGFRVAIAEQTAEAPKARAGKTPAQKGPLPRAVVRLVTPGTLTEDELLEAGRSNLLVSLASIAARKGAATSQWGSAWIDISTGQFETASCDATDLEHLLARLDPAEILAPADLSLGDYEARRASAFPAPAAHTARARLAEAFGVASLDAFGTFGDAEAAAAMAAVDYIRRSQAGALPRLGHPVPQSERGSLGLDPATRASLDLLRARDGGQEHTLFAAVDRTVTAPGARLLSQWIASPLTDVSSISARQECWDWMRHATGKPEAFRTVLRGAPDIDRALGRLSVGRGQPRDLAALRDGVRAAHEAATLAPESKSAGKTVPPLLAEAFKAMRGCVALFERFEAALSEELPARIDDGGFIATGFDEELDAHRSLRDDSRRVILSLQNEYAQRFGVASLKIRHHAQLGYVIEAPTAAAAKLRDVPELSFRQGTASAARFSTAELADLDSRISEAAERAAARERQIFAALTQEALTDPGLPALAAALALLDVVQSCASLAAGGAWSRAKVEDGEAFELEACRHPVVEAALGSGVRFTANACSLAPERRVMLLTGPNMAGKSTFLRQTALAVILAQAGLPVPAKSARIGVVDRLFSRVGAADDLARGRSTFMVEMTETAAILNQAGPRSLVVVDEIGRGTSTLDGLSIAWAVLEAMHSTLRCRAIFATHFHELAQLAETLPRLSPHTMAVRDWKGNVVFQHEVVAGTARKSWGVHVAKLAGVPGPVVDRAARLLRELEQDHSVGQRPLPLFEDLSPTPAAPPASCEDDDERADEVLALLSRMDPDSMSPREALDALYEIKKAMLEAKGHLTRG
ncbi:DNA mismatch repair protein MutS [Acetobacter nitrogenifigens DSM 23921 = NBRC 105050]|uniref:DNA mismatch repair protein MutS n=2 Tax=Acetobacter nitrogenifigens TaxID=285268 RepID=A0A511X8B3_9PROT|nr:DNA mismatch repair protein MutS [Acetobacter nitrogenifigens DSM 23921 = NBRC 105050]GEN59190.1 DNA mismatch repair protein MutS [Acetobacter nitrogenifigens DSM 23921 = NBRC 105050]